jgi:hypothetical protein
MPNSKKRAFFEICPRKSPPLLKTQDLHPKNVEKLKSAGQKISLSLPLISSPQPLSPYSSPTPQTVKRPHRKKVPSQKPHNHREIISSPHPLARHVDLNPEKFDSRLSEKIHFPRVFEVFSAKLSAFFPHRSLTV